jgi:hypothetical protein
MRSAVLFASLLVVAMEASAFIDPPVFAPQPIRANEPGSVSYRRGVCDGFPSVGFPIEIVQLPPNRIQLFMTGLHFTEPILCSITVATPSFTLPPLEAGEYQMELYVRNRANPAIPIHNGPVATFTVVGTATLVPVPSLNLTGLVALILGLLGLSAYGVRRD